MNHKRQLQRIHQNARKLIRQEIPRRIERALQGVGVVVGNKALEYTPQEFSTLINSQFRQVEPINGGYRVRIGYTQNYAAALHNRTDWSPRPPDQKAGPAWNPKAKPRFLTDAAKETEKLQDSIVNGELRL